MCFAFKHPLNQEQTAGIIFFYMWTESLPKFICLTETHLDDDNNTSNFRLPGYSSIEVKNRNKYGGGVMIQVHECDK